MDNPTITVLMPVYNAGIYIGEAIRSVLDQHFSDFELLIINDGSTDNTVDVINSFVDSRIRLIHQSNQGVSAALNNGLAVAKAELIARMDADDICRQDRLKTQYEYLQSNPDCVVTGSDAEYISQEGDFLFYFTCKEYDDAHIKVTMYDNCPFIHSSVMYRKEQVLQAGGYSTAAHQFEDHLLWVNLASTGQFRNLPLPLIRVRFNQESVTIDEKWRSPRFRQLKKQVIRRGSITPLEGQQLLSMIQVQDSYQFKKGAYYALCGKKFLFNNHRAKKARGYFLKSIRLYPARLDNYLLYLLSYFPYYFIHWVHQKKERL